MEGRDVELEWLPFELRPYPHETLSPHSDYIQKAWHNNVLPLAERLNVTMKLNMTDPQPHTHLAHEGLLFAKERDNGKANDYADRVFRAFYEGGEDIGDSEVLRKHAEAAGFDGEDFSKALAERTYSQARQASIRRAHQEGIQAVPTFIIGEKRMTGLQPEEAYAEALDEEGA
ncbi:2-hydroxychromene-2-carboxylate isomerase [Alkalicoccus urumqiensis]|uniref:2-hydroxychromene-2-carboxylate isomerase n=2 Tax=Alkalicoccus urumqiensis TaxID=1548213 RepID=A0A2P6MH02_ALKUR|nr:2-hydroxychromene-2-carboxylate isomerase [Alkalicoccus urumqiensis]